MRPDVASIAATRKNSCPEPRAELVRRAGLA